MQTERIYHKASDDRIQQSLPRFNPAVRAKMEDLQALDRIGVEQQLPELAIALAIMKQAFHDLTCPHAAIRDDARDYLLRRVWEEEDVIGQVLRHYGVRRFTKGRLIHAHIHVVDGDTHLPMAARRNRHRRQRSEAQSA